MFLKVIIYQEKGILCIIFLKERNIPFTISSDVSGFTVERVSINLNENFNFTKYNDVKFKF